MYLLVKDEIAKRYSKAECIGEATPNISGALEVLVIRPDGNNRI